MRNWWPLLLAVLGIVVLMIFATTPPGPRGLDTPPSAFSAERAMADVREIARAPHPTGSPDNARVRAWLIGRLTGLGMTVRTTSTPLSARGAKGLLRWSGSTATPPVVNIIATLPGGDTSAPAVLVLSHYDSVWGSPGAADDGAGVAAALEIARAIKADAGRRRPLMVVFTDGEELGLEGAKALFAADPDRGKIGVVVNMEARGGGGRTAMFETGRENGAMMRLFADAVGHPSATSLSVLIYELLPNSSDLTESKKRGLPGFNFAFIGRPGLYHSPLATADNLDQGSLQDMGDQALGTTRALVNAPALPAKAPNLVFFDVLGLAMIVYPPVVGWLVLGVAAVLLGVAAWRVRAGAGDIGRGALATVVTLLLGAGFLFMFNLLSGAGASANYYDRLAAIPWLQVQALLLGGAAVALSLLLRRRDGNAVATAIGTALPLFVVAVVLQIIAPTAAFIVAWPVMFAGVVAAALALLRGRAGTIIAVGTVAMEGAYVLAFAFFLMQAIGPDTPSAAALPLAVVAMLAWPLVPRVASRRLLRVAIVLVLAATGVALKVRLDPMAASVATYSLKG